RKILLPQGPKHRCERHQDQQISQRNKIFPRAEFLRILTNSRRGNMNEFLSSEPKNDRSNEHENARRPKGNSRGVFIEQFGYQYSRKCRTEVDGKIEPTEYPRQQMLVGRAKLVANIG